MELSKFILLSSLLLASAALASPSFLVEAPLARGRDSEDRQSPPINHVASRADNEPEVIRYQNQTAGVVVSKNGPGVNMVPMVHDHVRSHFFAIRELSLLSQASSLSQTFLPPTSLLSILCFASTVTPAAGIRYNLVSTTMMKKGTMVRDIEFPLRANWFSSFVH